MPTASTACQRGATAKTAPSGEPATDHDGGVAVVEDPDAKALSSLLRRPPDNGRPSHHARLDGIAPLLAMLVDG